MATLNELQHQAAEATGSAADTKETDPDAATATIIALLKGCLEALNAIKINTDT
jgi:hypothetical protein